MNVSQDVISDWETGERIPDPDKVDKLEKLYKAPGLWHGWMRYQYKSYRDRYPENPEDSALALSMVNAGYQMSDAIQRQEAAIRDAMDGKIDNKRAFDEYIKEAKEAHAALGLMIAKAEMREGQK